MACPRNPDRNERGAVTLTVALCMSVLLGVASFALDLGMARVGVRDMQALSDLVALDQAKLLDGRTTAQLYADSAWHTALAASVARNDSTFPAEPDVVATLGVMDPVTHEFTPTSGTEVPTAVKVDSSATVDYLLRTGESAVSRDATAMNEKTACIAVGSYAAQVKGNASSLMASLVGTKLNLSVVSYQGLADLDIRMSQLATQLGVGDVDGLVDVNHITVGDFYVAIAQVLRNNGQTAAASLLEGTLRANVSGLPAIDLGGLISVHNPNGAVLDGRMNVLDLVAGSAFLADGTNFASIPALKVNLNPTGLSATDLTLQDVKIIQKPLFNCGKIGTKAYNSQIDLTLRGPLASVAIPNPGIPVATVNGTINLKVTVALAEGTLSVIDCKQGTVTNPDKVTVDTHTQLLRPELTLDLGVKVLLVTVPLSVKVTAPQQFADTPVVVNLPPNVQHMDAGASQLAGAGIVFGSNTLTATVLNAVTGSIVTPVAKAADSMINGSLRTVLGIDVASADVFAWPRPQCFSSILVD